MVFLLVAGVCLVLALSGLHRRREAGRTAQILRSLLASDVRFQKVTVSSSTNARVYLHGSVASGDDRQALRTLVEQAHLPVGPGISVEVDSTR